MSQPRARDTFPRFRLPFSSCSQSGRPNPVTGGPVCGIMCRALPSPTIVEEGSGGSEASQLGFRVYPRYRDGCACCCYWSRCRPGGLVEDGDAGVEVEIGIGRLTATESLPSVPPRAGLVLWLHHVFRTESDPRSDSIHMRAVD